MFCCQAPSGFAWCWWIPEGLFSALWVSLTVICYNKAILSEETWMSVKRAVQQRTCHKACSWLCLWVLVQCCSPGRVSHIPAVLQDPHEFTWHVNDGSKKTLTLHTHPSAYLSWFCNVPLVLAAVEPMTLSPGLWESAPSSHMSIDLWFSSAAKDKFSLDSEF